MRVSHNESPLEKTITKNAKNANNDDDNAITNNANTN